MLKCIGLFQVDTGTANIEFSLIDKGSNHCQISNDSHVLFDGFILEGVKIFEQKAKEQEQLANFAGWKYTRIK